MLSTRLPNRVSRVSRRWIKQRLHLHTPTTPTTDETREHLRELLRETAQSVAVVTSFLPHSSGERHHSQPSRSHRTSKYHGATLSSFTSIALNPLPLVAFSLRIPSRMAFALTTHWRTQNESHDGPCTAHLVINVLSAAQQHVAEQFARADIYPKPFEDPNMQWTVSEDGLPILSGALGALSCSLVTPSIPLANLQGFGKQPMLDQEQEVQQVAGGSGLASELFLARVVRVERVPPAQGSDDGLQCLPLLYHRRQYATVRGLTKS